jgi:hypothetical protein
MVKCFDTKALYGWRDCRYSRCGWIITITTPYKLVKLEEDTYFIGKCRAGDYVIYSWNLFGLKDGYCGATFCFFCDDGNEKEVVGPYLMSSGWRTEALATHRNAGTEQEVSPKIRMMQKLQRVRTRYMWILMERRHLPHLAILLGYYSFLTHKNHT